MSPFDAIVLSGGGARRLGGLVKTALDVGGRPLLARATDAVREADRVVVVGDPAGASRVDVSTIEVPAGGGPVAGVAAGLAHVDAELVVVLAGDQPFVTAEVIRQLRDAVAEHDAAVAADGGGRCHWLLAVWRTAALRSAVGRLDTAAGKSMASVYRDADTAAVRFTGTPPPWVDVDTPEDLAAARRETHG